MKKTFSKLTISTLSALMVLVTLAPKAAKSFFVEPIAGALILYEAASAIHRQIRIHTIITLSDEAEKIISPEEAQLLIESLKQSHFARTKEFATLLVKGNRQRHNRRVDEIEELKENMKPGKKSKFYQWLHGHDYRVTHPTPPRLDVEAPITDAEMNEVWKWANFEIRASEKGKLKDRTNVVAGFESEEMALAKKHLSALYLGNGYEYGGKLYNYFALLGSPLELDEKQIAAMVVAFKDYREGDDTLLDADEEANRL